MQSFQRKNFLQQLKMGQEELNAYYRELRKYQYLKDDPVKGTEWRKAMNAVCLGMLRIDRMLVKRELEVFDDKRIIGDKPRVYACSHVGRYDIESAMEAIGEQVYFVMGDPGKTYRNFEGLFLNMQGRVCLDTGYQVSEQLRNISKWDYRNLKVMNLIKNYISCDYADPELLEFLKNYQPGDYVDPIVIDAVVRASNYELIDTENLQLLLDYKMDRHIAQDTCVKYLKAGSNILIYPEGAWNLSSNLLIAKLFSGTAKMAMDGNADIIPIGIIKDGKRYIVNIGRNIDASKYKDFKVLTSDLRDAMCTLKWEVMESRPGLKRETLSSTAESDYVDEIMAETTNGYDREIIRKSSYIDSIPSPDEVFEPIKKLSKVA